MNPIAGAVARAVRRNRPHALCFSCLATQQGLPEHDVRSATLILVARDDFRIVHRVCHLCGATEETLVCRKDGDGAA